MLLVCWAPLHSMFTKSEEKWSLLEVVRCVSRVLEDYDCRTKFNSSLGMEYNGELYGFSAVKVKFEDRSFSAEFVHGSDGKTDLTYMSKFLI